MEACVTVREIYADPEKWIGQNIRVGGWVRHLLRLLLCHNTQG